MRQKNFLSLLLTLCMIMTILPHMTFASGSITVNVTLAQNGQFITGVNDAKIALTEIAVTDSNDNPGYDIDDVLCAAHELYYADGASGYASLETQYGKSITKLWGDESGSYGYYTNNRSAWSLSDPIADGDSIYAFIYQDTAAYTDAYTYFDKSTASIATNEGLSLSLNKIDYDEFYNPIAIPLENTVITINGSSTDYATNAEGIVNISFENSGTYILSAMADYYIAPPVCIVTVTEAAQSTVEPPLSTEAPSIEPTLPPVASDVDYISIIDNTLNKIAEGYVKNTEQWFDYPEWYVMDLGAYAIYAPESENVLSDDTKQKFVNSAINSIKKASKDTDIDKAALALSAIGKNPERLFSADKSDSFSVIDQLSELEKSASAWSAPYTLAVYNIGNFNTEDYENELISQLLENQEDNGSWNEYDTIIDTTANAIVGLSFYMDRPEVNTAVSNALSFLSAQQNDNGAFLENSNSTAMVLIGLAAVGVDLKNDSRFIKNGKNILDGLLSFLLAGGSGFGYKNNQSSDSYATEQSFRALISAANWLKTGEAYNVYDFSKNELTPAYEISEKSDKPSSSGGSSRPSKNNSKKETIVLSPQTGLANKNAAVKKLPVINKGKTFADIVNSAYKTKIEVLAERNMINGRAENEFAPLGTMTRAEFAAIIVKSLGLDFTGENIFVDVADNSWYKDYIKTAYFYGVIKGISATEFNPEGTITKEEAGVMLHRAAKLCGLTGTYKETAVRDILSGFTDYIAVSEWAKEALAFCYDNDILSDSDIEILPKQAVIREQIAAMLYNVLYQALLIEG